MHLSQAQGVNVFGASPIYLCWRSQAISFTATASCWTLCDESCAVTLLCWINSGFGELSWQTGALRYVVFEFWNWAKLISSRVVRALVLEAGGCSSIFKHLLVVLYSSLQGIWEVLLLLMSSYTVVQIISWPLIRASCGTCTDRIAWLLSKRKLEVTREHHMISI